MPEEELEAVPAAAPEVHDDTAPPPAEETAGPQELAWDGMTEQERSDLLVEAKVPALGFSRFLWDQLPVDVKATLGPFLS